MLNELYQGPVLILQGVLDPLNNAQKRADDLEEAIPLATKVCIDAGHCPHDEVPEKVNDAIADFVEHVVAMAGSTGEESRDASGGFALESSAA
jgi:pimeloyl-ACP methyl ester carboxylesterase